MTRSCDRRSFDAATIFMAFVICCVFFMARTRRRRSIRDGILRRRRLPSGEAGRALFHGFGQRRSQLIVELLLLCDPAEELWVPVVDEGVALGLAAGSGRIWPSVIEMTFVGM